MMVLGLRGGRRAARRGVRQVRCVAAAERARAAGRAASGFPPRRFPMAETGSQA